MRLTETGLTILKSKYLGEGESPEQMLTRVAKVVSDTEQSSVLKGYYFSAYYRMMDNLEFLPNSPTLMNAGKRLGMLSACFVLPIEDSIESIMETLKNTAVIFKSGGGVGINFSTLRPEGAFIKSSEGTSSGPISFMKMFDTMTETVKQGGKRKGALMGVLNIDHPDIRKFITCKQDLKNLTNFNISVGITDAFMHAVRNDQDWFLVDPHTNQVVERTKARELWDLLVDCAWNTGEPGVLFLDTINNSNPTKNSLGYITTTNPCGEQPLGFYESCNLGAINLAKFVKEDTQEVDVAGLTRTIQHAVRFLDSVIDVNNYPLPEIKENTLKTRKIGLGVMGLHDMLVKLGIQYGSEESFVFVEKLFKLINDASITASELLAEEKGTFPLSGKSDIKAPRRNAVLTTCQPTGTVSMLANASAGIEPYFMLTYFRNAIDTTFTMGNDLFVEYLKKAGKSEEEVKVILEKVMANNGKASEIEEIPEDIRRLFITAQDLTPEQHVRMQSAIQKGVGSAVSKTVNLPNSATREDVHNIYMLAHQSGCKGTTVYRDGCRQPVYTTKIEQTTLTEKCPECGSDLHKEEKCTACKNCGYSKCNL